MEIFCGGVGQVDLGEGLVFMSLLRKLSQVGDSTGDPIHELVMPPNGFLQLFGEMEGVVKKLEEEGVIHRGEDNA